MTTPDVGAQLRKGVVEYCVLGLLQQAPAYGWSISQRLVSLGLIGGIGTLYPLLARLRSQRLIVAHDDPPARDDASAAARPRKYYTLTAEGRTQLDLFRAQWHPFAAAVTAITDAPAPPPATTPPSTSAAPPAPTRSSPPAADAPALPPTTTSPPAGAPASGAPGPTHLHDEQGPTS